MVRFSTPHSIKSEQVSILAVVETLIAIALSIYLYVSYESILHIAFAALLAPFLLLRTKRSTEQALALVEITSSRLERFAYDIIPEVNTTSRMVGWIVFAFVLVVVIALWIANIATIFLIKFGVVSYNLITNFVDSLSSIPDNWRRVVLYTDICSYPEIVPGIEDYKSTSRSIRDLRASQAFQDIYSETFLPIELKRKIANSSASSPLTKYQEPEVIDKPFAAESILRLWSILMALCIYVPAVIYRFSLKSTSLIWCPLFWAFRPIRLGDDAADFAHAICVKTKYKLSRLFSLCIIILIFAKVLAMAFGILAAEHISNDAVKSAIMNFFVPSRIPMWQVAALINSILTWWILFKAENYIYNFSGHRNEESDRMLLFFRRTFVLRNLLTIYTSISLFYIVAQTSSSFDVFSTQILWFPWQ